MDDDTAELVRQLCTRAGMVMEDASPLAILVGGKGPEELRQIVATLESLNDRTAAILAAAAALMG